MHFRTILPIIAVLFLVSPTFGVTYMTKFSTERYHEKFPMEESNYLTCYDDGRTVDAKLQKNSMDAIFQSIQNKNACDVYESVFCLWLSRNEFCIGTMNTCEAISGNGSAYICTKKTFEAHNLHISNSITSNEISELREAHAINCNTSNEHYETQKLISINSKPVNETFQVRVTAIINSITSNGSSGALRRKRRQASACFHPSMQTSSLSFIKYPSSIWAKQKCIFGYTLKEGISREMRCVYAENKWKPTGFEECRPFIDCSIELASTGQMQCFTATAEKAPICNITCDRYEDKVGVPIKSYECQIYGGWKPKLPFCATPGTGLDVVSAPRIRVHPIEIEPEPKLLKKLVKVVKEN